MYEHEEEDNNDIKDLVLKKMNSTFKENKEIDL
jgi:hypothetical protein